MSFLKPKAQAAPAPIAPAPVVPERTDTQVEAAAAEQRKKYSGRSATNLLTGGLGVTDTASTATAKLLGQSGTI